MTREHPDSLPRLGHGRSLRAARGQEGAGPPGARPAGAVATRSAALGDAET